MNQHKMIGQIKEYYLEQKLIFEEMFSVAVENFDVEAIHKMRTTTKRLRALFVLIRFLSSKKFKAKKQLRKIRNLFKYAGKIREIQIEQLLTYELEQKMNLNFVEYRQYLLMREHKEISRFIKSIPKFTNGNQILNDKKILKAIQSVNPAEAEKRTNIYLDKQTETLKKLNGTKIANGKIHKSRTILKQMYYLYDILKNLTGREILENVSKERMREVEQLIGNWHDKVNSFHYLNAFFKTKNGRKTPKYKMLKIQITTDRDSMKREIAEILRKEIL